MDAARSATHVLKDPPVVKLIYTDGKIQQDRNTTGMTPKLITSVWIGAGHSVSPTRMGIQDIGIPRGSIGPQEGRDNQPLDTSINGIYAKHRDLAPTWSKVYKPSADVYSRCRMNLTRDAVLNKIQNFMNLGLSSVHTSDEIGSVFIPPTIIGRPDDGSNWLPPGHRIGEVAADRVIRMGSGQNYNAKTDFETRRENQDFGRQNNSMSQPPLKSTPIGTNTTNRKTSPIDSIPVRPQRLEPATLTLPTDLPEQNGKLHVPGDPDTDS